MYGFEFVAVETVDDAVGLMREHGEDAKILAGGQSLIPILHYRLARPRVVIDINSLPLGEITVDDGRVSVGALVRYHQLEESETISRRCPVLAEGARLIGNVRVRTLGTVGGSLAHADPAAELPAVMTALDARLAVASASGRRTLAAREFFTGPLTTALAPGEIVTGVEIAPVSGYGWAVEEISRRAGDFAIVAVVALVRLDRLGRVDDARLAFGGVADRPVHARAAEDTLRGHEPTGHVLVRAAQVAREALDPPSDAFVSAAYRRHVAGVLCRRALTRAVARALA
ncbi:MAG TPA: xanthine dehydrogenase family protein subunit M [Methylomirabilota bacterium]